MIAKVDERLRDKDMGIVLTEAAKVYVATKGYDPVLGARPLRRTIQRDIEEQVIAVFEDPQAVKPTYLMWLEWTEGRISFIRDYRYVRYVVDDAELVLAPDAAPPAEATAHG